MLNMDDVEVLDIDITPDIIFESDNLLDRYNLVKNNSVYLSIISKFKSKEKDIYINYLSLNYDVPDTVKVLAIKMYLLINKMNDNLIESDLFVLEGLLDKLVSLYNSNANISVKNKYILLDMYNNSFIDIDIDKKKFKRIFSSSKIRKYKDNIYFIRNDYYIVSFIRVNDDILILSICLLTDGINTIISNTLNIISNNIDDIDNNIRMINNNDSSYIDTENIIRSELLG